MRLCGLIWGVPKIRGTILVVPIARNIVFWGLYWGPLILGNYHIMFGFRDEGTGFAIKVWGCRAWGLGVGFTVKGLGVCRSFLRLMSGVLGVILGSVS